MTMQRRHFQFIADVIRMRYRLNEEQGAMIALLFAEELAHTNPNFDRERFLQACMKG